MELSPEQAKIRAKQLEIFKKLGNGDMMSSHPAQKSTVGVIESNPEPYYKRVPANDFRDLYGIPRYNPHCPPVRTQTKL